MADGKWYLYRQLVGPLENRRKRTLVFGDMKAHGFDLESTMLRHAERLSRLTLAVAFLYVWMISTGIHTIKNGLRFLVDRRKRRDLSIFQIGLRFIDRQLLNSFPFPLILCLYL
jgi:hypothetical protein